jgi:hypothetical protein
VLAAYGLLLVVALLYGAVGVACSALSRNTSTATVMAYGILLLLFFGTFPLAIAGMGRPFGGPGFGTGLGAVNPIGAVMAGTGAERYFGITLPAWAPALLLNGLLSILLIVIAIHRLEYPRTDRSGLLRALTALFAGLLVFFLYGFLLPGNALGMDPRDGFQIAAAVTVLACCVLVSLFATGEGLPQGGVLSALDPRRLRRGEAPSGMVYVLLLVALCGLVLLLGAPEDVLPQVGGLVILLALFTFCFSAAGLLLSAILANRWGALALTLAVVLLLSFVPLTSLMSHRPGGRGSPLDNALYLSPFPAAVQISRDPAPGGRPDFWRNIPPLWGGRTPFYVITPVLYGGLGVALLVAAQIVHNARRGRREASAAPVPVATS